MLIEQIIQFKLRGPGPPQIQIQQIHLLVHVLLQLVIFMKK